jgi:heme/copper-type cytochrome/quinol oxidase subunit 4
MISDKTAFVEKQYLGREFIPITIRLVLAMFCFAAYFFTDERERNGDLLVVVGFAIIIISIVMGFLLHFSTRVENKSIRLAGLWTARVVKIDLNGIVKAEKGSYSRYLFNNPVYNLHTKGTIRFYAAGNDAIHLTDRDGMVYIIGSQHVNEFLRAIKEEMKK